MTLTSPIASIPYFEPGDNPRVDIITQGVAFALDTVVCPVMATTTARDLFYADAIAGTGHYASVPQVGMTCYVTSRKGKCYWNGAKWVWQSTHEALLMNHYSAAADTVGASPVVIAYSPTLVLTGARRLQITARTLATALTGTCIPRGFVFGPGIATGEDWMTAQLAAIGGQVSLSQTWNVVASGSVVYELRGLEASGGSQTVRFTSSFLEILDLGPTDDVV